MQLANTTLFSDGNLVEYYQLENLTGKNGNTLTNTGGVTLTPAVYLNGANFTATNTTMDLAVASNLGVLDTAYSVAGWVKVLAEPALNTNTVFFSLSTKGSGAMNPIRYDVTYMDVSGTKQLFFNRSKTGTIGIDQGPTYTVDLGITRFHHIAFTWDGSNIHGYVDGIDVTGAYAASGSGTSGANNFCLANEAIPLGSSWSSSIIDDVPIFTRALTAAEVQLLATNPSPGFIFELL